MKKLSVVVAIYNTKEFLETCLNSLVNQNYRELDIILVDDGSTDGSSEICEMYAQRYNQIKVIHQKNKGKLEARYNGVNLCKSEYVTFVDSDDFIEPDTYTNMKQYMEEGIDVISYRIIRYFDKNNCVYSKDSVEKGIYRDSELTEIKNKMIWDYKKNKGGIDPSLCNKIMRKDLVFSCLENAKKLSIGYGDDVVTTYQVVAKANTYCATDNYNYYHRQRNKKDIPEYLLDPYFYKKLTDLCYFLKDFFEFEKQYVEQIDAYFWYGVNYRNNKVGYPLALDRYLTPFDAINAGTRLVLYGAGNIGREYYRQITKLNYCTIVSWIDKYECGEIIEGCKINDLASIREVEFDFILISIKNNQVADQVIDELHTCYGIDKSKFIHKYVTY